MKTVNKIKAKVRVPHGHLKSKNRVQPVQPPLKRESDVDAAAVAIGVSAKTIRRWIKSGCPHDRDTGAGGAIKLNLAEIGHWLKQHPERGTVGRPAEQDATILEARRRKENALAAIYEFQLSELRGDAQSIESQKSCLENCILRLLSELSMPPLTEDLSLEFREKYENWISGLRIFLQESWHESVKNPARPRDQWPIAMLQGFGIYLTDHASELSMQPTPEIRLKLSDWVAGFMREIKADAPASTLPTGQIETTSEDKPHE